MRIIIALAALLLAVIPARAAQQYSNIACETSSTSGTGTINLAGAISAQGYLGFIQSGITSGNTVPYYIKNSNKIEVGWGVVTDASPDTMTRNAVITTDDQSAPIDELTLSGSSTVCIGFLFEILTNGAGYLVNADTLDSLNSTSFLPAGSDTQVQYNDGGSWGGDTGLLFNETTNDLTVGGDVSVGDDVLIASTNEINWNSGQAVIGHVSGQSYLTLNGSAAPAFLIGATSLITSGSLQVHGVATAATSVVARWSADANPPRNTMLKAHSGTIGTWTIVQDDDELGAFSFAGADGTDGAAGAAFGAFVDGAPGNNDMPGRLYFSTTPDNTEVPVQRLGIKPDGGVIVGPDDTSPGAKSLIVDDQGTFKLGEAEANGDNFFALAGPASLGGDVTCTIDSSGKIPTSCLSSSGAAITGTPVDNQVAVWSSASAIEGDSAFTFDTTSDALSIGTSGAFTTGTIELGAASDTTLARSAAGKATLETKAVKTAGRQTISLYAGAGTIPVGGAINGCSSATAVDSGSNDNFWRACAFDASTDNALFWTITFPKSADESAGWIVRIDWESTTTTDSTDDVIWTAAGVCMSNDDSINANAVGTAVNVTDTQTAAGDFLSTSETSTITPAGTWAEGDMCLLRVTRDADNGSDTFNGNARLIAVQLYWTDNAPNQD